MLMGHFCSQWVVVVQNDAGDFMQCISGFMESTLDPFLSEILVVTEALSCLMSLHLDNVVIETDSQGL
ncbi:hypothetical protein PVK06_045451 [Gossypium arboreum]|uniref:RNase H type-1 domain-containing protein n=1 Tax=Gossypium arboreum TaxID=29729 RepID=A0ABR0MWM9_GOSAR|nr:hypothetical protein PVK06_045451 [Gossypium arboreum]